MWFNLKLILLYMYQLIDMKFSIFYIFEFSKYLIFWIFKIM